MAADILTEPLSRVLLKLPSSDRTFSLDGAKSRQKGSVRIVRALLIIAKILHAGCLMISALDIAKSSSMTDTLNELVLHAPGILYEDLTRFCQPLAYVL